MGTETDNSKYVFLHRQQIISFLTVILVCERMYVQNKNSVALSPRLKVHPHRPKHVLKLIAVRSGGQHERTEKKCLGHWAALKTRGEIFVSEFFSQRITCIRNLKQKIIQPNSVLGSHMTPSCEKLSKRNHPVHRNCDSSRALSEKLWKPSGMKFQRSRAMHEHY